MRIWRRENNEAALQRYTYDTLWSDKIHESYSFYKAIAYVCSSRRYLYGCMYLRSRYVGIVIDYRKVSNAVRIIHTQKTFIIFERKLLTAESENEEARKKRSPYSSFVSKSTSQAHCEKVKEEETRRYTIQL